MSPGHHNTQQGAHPVSAKKPAMSPTDTPLEAVLDRASGPRRAEVDELLALHREVSGEEPVVWAGRIMGFGEVEYRYESGHSGRMPILAFAPGAARHTVYLSRDFAQRWPDLLESLGNHRASKACLYFPRLSKINLDALRGLLERTLADTREQWG